MIHTQIAAVISSALKGLLSEHEVLQLLETPKQEQHGDVAFPCFTLAKHFRKSPAIIADELKVEVTSDLILKAEVAGGYVNFFVNQDKATEQILTSVLAEQDSYGSQPIKDEKIVIDYSSPNIAKPFSMGHLRSTVIGQSLAYLSEKNGYEVIRINYIGDWGTQFGKLITAYRMWGDEALIKKEPIKELLELYVRFHEQAKSDDSLNDDARAAFKALEEGNQEAKALWSWFREESLKEFETYYDLLGIQFDSNMGEAFYNDKMQPVVQELEQKNLLTVSDGAYVVELENLPPCLITKKDGATLYATRDLTAALYRQQTFKPVKTFYVVGHEQTLHFQQVFHVLKKMGHEWAESLEHIGFGMMLVDGSKMSTRQGKVVLLADVLAEAIKTAERNMGEKYDNQIDKRSVATQIGVGAVIFNDLKNLRTHDLDFSLEQMLSFEGNTGPYVQYTHARISSILEKGDYHEEPSTPYPLGATAWPAVKLLDQFPAIVQKSYEQADPSMVAKYSLQLARAFNKYYAHSKILGEDEGLQTRLAFSHAVSLVLKESLRLLGIAAPERM
ncbi:arginine--tRNA ligase [Alkalicoccobacillus porphyridii]|uniref:Arginine--tRNA ligase n=1 Tax=Alkalicoccobacillus porphyridii TaxID=2597270 RepID=A0A553ZVK9_9BACI|nr:arginine--tRNA ligase [Alkalicoccobacillus porphyridii]TSB45346.1 arginine--tRNA ligase [Alkalicoccobacillus porphyridii]